MRSLDQRGPVFPASHNFCAEPVFIDLRQPVLRSRLGCLGAQVIFKPGRILLQLPDDEEGAILAEIARRGVWIGAEGWKIIDRCFWQ